MVSVVCAGIVTADVVFRVERLPERAIKYAAAESALTSGGCALNAAVAIARLGGEAHLAGTIGEDVLGDLIRAEMAAEGVLTDLLARSSSLATSRSAVLVRPDGERAIVNHRDPRLFEAELALSEPFPHGAALADTRWPLGAERLLRAARASGRPAVLDAEAPVALAEGAVHAATHVAFSEQGLSDWTGTTDPSAGLAQAARRLGSWVCVTRGAASVLVHDAAGPREIPAFEVPAVDTLGAGDVWHGALALFLAEGFVPDEAVRRANAVAALKIAAFGGREAVPSRALLERFLQERTVAAAPAVGTPVP